MAFCFFRFKSKSLSRRFSLRFFSGFRVVGVSEGSGLGLSVLFVLVEVVELFELLFTDRVCFTWLGVVDRVGRVALTVSVLSCSEFFFFILVYRFSFSGFWVCFIIFVRESRG